MIKKINEVYEWDAKAYHESSDMQYDIALELLQKIEIKEDQCIIDAGCGSGRVTARILERLPRGKVIGVDLSINMLNAAREYVIPSPGQQVEFMHANLQNFSLPATADGIFSSMAMHFILDHGLMMKNLANTLRPGGWLALQFGINPMENGPFKKLQELVTAPKYAQYLNHDMPPMHEASVEASEQDLLQAGLTKVTVESISLNMSHRQIESMKRFFKNNLFAEKLPAELREEFFYNLNIIMDEMFGRPFEYIRCQASKPQIH